MSIARKVALVTGGNKGIGFAIVAGLCRGFRGDVILASRDLSRGREAVRKLEAQGLKPKLHQLEIDNPQSVSAVKDFLLKEYGGLDLLVNNAAIAFPVHCSEPFLVQAQETLKVNYFATVAICHELFPILRPGARVVNVSSSAGMLFRVPGQQLREKLSNPSRTEEEIDALAKEYLTQVEQGIHEKVGWSNSAYSTSKVLLTSWTLLQQKKFDADTSRPDIVINAVHPGYVNTDMTRGKGTLSIEEGAKSPIFAALIPPGEGPRGKMIWYTTDVVDWANEVIQVMEKPSRK